MTGHGCGAEVDDKMLGSGKAPQSRNEIPPVNDDTACGFGRIRGKWLQRFANKKAYVTIYGILGLVMSAAHSYFNGTITTIEKRFKIPSRTTGIITVGSDITQLLIGLALNYLAAKGHRPRWIALGVYAVVLFCAMSALPHLIYGPGPDALDLTYEGGGSKGLNSSTKEVLDIHNRQVMCQLGNGTGVECDKAEGSYVPPLIFLVAHMISGLGSSLYYTLGVAYMDDNIVRSKTPALISLTYFIRMLGPALGYAMASFCLKLYIAPSLTPKIDKTDPRWLGAWWLGWIVIGGIMFIAASLLGLFPRVLPRAAMRKAQENDTDAIPAEKPSVSDLIRTVKKLLSNKILVYNNLASIFYFMGYMPYWIFMPKYIETIYKQSASNASLITGTVGLVFSACGVLLSGMVISKFKPGARPLAAWNVLTGIISVAGILSYMFLGCSSDYHLVGTELNTTCNSNCHCDYVKYSPVCLQGNTYISACHAGCVDYTFSEIKGKQSKVYTNCSCAKNLTNMLTEPEPLIATSGPCPVDCKAKFLIFLSVVCALKFFGATGRASNFLVSVRCVDEEDKTVSMGLGLMMMSLFAFIPSPIFYGNLIDSTCLVWGKTCGGIGNCWLYNANTLIYLLNLTSAVFVTIGSLFDCCVWYYVKGLPIFDEQVSENVMEMNGKPANADPTNHKKAMT